jgi:hypothetical protein
VAASAMTMLALLLLWLERHGDSTAIWRSYLPEVSPA